MTNPQRAKLAQLIRGRTGTNAEIAAAIAAESVTRVTAFVTRTSIYRAVGFAAGLQLTGALEAMSASNNPAVALQGREILALLDPSGPGVDVSLDEVRGVIDGLQAAGVMTADVAATIKGLGERRSLDFTPTADDVAEAIVLNMLIAETEAEHRALSNEYNAAASVIDARLGNLNRGEL